MMGTHPVIHSKIEGEVAVVIGFVNLVYQRRAFVCPNSVPSMAGTAVLIKCDAALQRWL